jgi:hypothetical protein
MKTIHKFVLEVTDEQRIEIPSAHSILTVQLQDKRICLWAIVDTNSPKTTRYFRIVGTGNPFNDCMDFTYIGTVQMENGKLVWHVFVL